LTDIVHKHGESNGQHLDEMTCLLYIDRQLDRTRGLEVSAHTQECGDCRTLLRALERESRLLTRAMLEEDEPLPSRLAAFQEVAKRSLQWIWGLAFGLAATGFYALYTGYVEPWQQRFEQAGFGGNNLLGLLIFQGAFWKGWQSMITLLEIVALLTLAGLGAAYFRRRLRRGSALALVLAGFCALMALPSAVMASEFRKGDSIDVAKDEIVKGDLFVSGARARIDGTVDGDVYAFCQNLTVNGHITGDIIAFAQFVRIDGQVDGNIRTFTNSVAIRGSVAKNATSFAESVTVDSTGKIGGSLTTFVNMLALDGNLARDLLIFSHRANISGTVGGSVQARGDELTIGSTAQIVGQTRFEGRNPPSIAAGAKLGSPVEFKKLEHKPFYTEGTYFVWQLIWAAAFVLFGLVLFVLMPKFSQEAVNSAEHYGASMGLGVLVFFAVPIAAVIACVTVVGLFIGISAFFVWYASLYYAQIVVGALVGKWLMGRTSETWPLIGRMVVGVLIVRACTAIPMVGGWIKFAVILWGLGAVSLALYRRFQPMIAPNVPAPPLTSPPLPPNTTVGSPQPA